MDIDKGVSTISLSGNDDFDIDDKFYINIPTNREMTVLLLTNEEDSFLKDFLLSSPNIKLDIVKPPKITSIEHDVFIINVVDKDMLLSKITDDIKKYVFEGGALIINSQEEYNQLGVYDISPIEIIEGIGDESELSVIEN